MYPKSLRIYFYLQIKREVFISTISVKEKCYIDSLKTKRE